MDQGVKLKLDQEETRRVHTGRGVRQGCCLSPILFNWYGEEVPEVFGKFKIEGHVSRTVKYADYLRYWLWKKRCYRE